MSPLDQVALVLMVLGTVFMLAGSIGIIRLPDFYTRTHANGKADTFGILLLLAGMAVHEGFTLVTAKLLIVMIFVALVNPAAVHALASVAMRIGLEPWFESESQPKGGD